MADIDEFYIKAKEKLEAESFQHGTPQVLHHSHVAGGETIQLAPSSAPPGCGCLCSFSASFPGSRSSHPLAAVSPRLWSSFLTPSPRGSRQWWPLQPWPLF